MSARPPKGRDGSNWQLVYRPPPGEGRPGKPGQPYQRSAGTQDAEEAKRKADAEQRRLNGECLPFHEVASRFLDYRKRDEETAPATIRKGRNALAAVERALADQLPTREVVLRAQDRLRAGFEGQEPLGSSTINVYLGWAKQAWTWAEHRKLVDTPWPKVKGLRAKRTKKRPMTREEATALLEAAQSYRGGYYHALIALIADTGCRSSEACSLTGGQVDLERGELRLWVTKTKARVVPVSPEVVALLPRVEPDQPVFPGPRTGRAMRAENLTPVWKRVKQLAGLGGEPIDVHSWRRTWIVDALRAGVDVQSGMRHVGHSSARTFLDYARLAPNDQAHTTAGAVRSYRSSARAKHPHRSPTSCEGGVIQGHTAEEDMGLKSLGRTQSNLAKALLAFDFRANAPHEVRRLRSVVAGVASGGPDAAAALLAVSRCPEVRAWLEQLAQP